jgi:hypothetical protein
MRCPAVVLALCAALPCGGCLYVHNFDEVVRDQEPKRTVAFESEAAARLFCAAVERQRKASYDDQEEFVWIPFITWISKSRRLSEAAFYNDQLVVCDTDGDGVITDAEAASYDQACGLVQSGQFDISFSAGPYEVRYPQPYARPPELTFPDGDGGLLDLTKLEQTAQGFRVYRATGSWPSAKSLKWRARGIPAPREDVPGATIAIRTPAVVLGAPAGEAPGQTAK